MNPSAIILQAFDMVMKAQLWPDKTPSETLQIIMYVHNKGWLYTPIVNDKVAAVICAYRIKEVTEESLVKIPVKEEGNILYGVFVVSFSDDAYSVIRSSLGVYLEENKDITELVLKDKNENIKRYNLRGAFDGEKQSAGITSNADVSN